MVARNLCPDVAEVKFGNFVNAKLRVLRGFSENWMFGPTLMLSALVFQKTYTLLRFQKANLLQRFFRKLEIRKFRTMVKIFFWKHGDQSKFGKLYVGKVRTATQFVELFTNSFVILRNRQLCTCFWPARWALCAENLCGHKVASPVQMLQAHNSGRHCGECLCATMFFRQLTC